MGPDQIAPKDLVMLGGSVEKGLFHVFKESIDTAKYPSAWKVSNLNPVFKKGGVTERANFRPISLLSVPGKLLEDIICKPIDNHMKVQGISSCRQWGFKQGRSTEGLLLHSTEQWKDALDNGFTVEVIFLDFRKAFDTVNHKILKQKLKGVGMNGRLLHWLEDYLTNRSHFTKVNGKLSEARVIKYGVPQGSLLGQQLYTIYVNDFLESVTKGELYMFADDTTIFTIGETVLIRYLLFSKK